MMRERSLAGGDNRELAGGVLPGFRFELIQFGMRALSWGYDGRSTITGIRHSVWR